MKVFKNENEMKKKRKKKKKYTFFEHVNIE